MMARRRAWIAPALAAAALLVSSGVGFASFTSSATVHASATPASIELVVTSVTLVAGPSYVTVQTTHLPAPIVQAWLNNTPPNTLFNLSVVIENVGTVPVQNIEWTFSPVFHAPPHGPSCYSGAYSGVPTGNYPPGDLLGPGASFDSFWWLHSGAFPTGCAGWTWATFTITYTGDAGP